MTNKINGIDVSEWELEGVLIPITECKYFEGIGDCKESKGLCIDNENCYFKQLKRLQEENEELKEKNKACGSKTIDLKEFYRRMDIIKTAINDLVWVIEDSEDVEDK